MSSGDCARHSLDPRWRRERHGDASPTLISITSPPRHLATTGATTSNQRAVALVLTRELLGMDARERSKHLGLRRRKHRQLEGEGHDELPNRHCRQDAVHQVRRHTPPGAARAEASIPTREGHKQVVLAPMASEVDEASRKVAAAETTAKLVLDVPKKRPVVRLTRVSKKIRAVLSHEPVEHRPVRLGLTELAARAQRGRPGGRS
jgi:hypothetical protein